VKAQLIATDPHLNPEVIVYLTGFNLDLHKLVSRTVCDTRSVTGEYAGTGHSRRLVKAGQALTDWGFRHHEALVGKKRFADPTAASNPIPVLA
jgi:hypothetical protein